MSFLGGLLSGIGSLAGGIFGGNSQQAAANTAAQEQENLQNTALQYLQNAATQQRGSIASLAPYATGGSTAASALQYAAPYLAPGQGAVFGGQQVKSTPTGGSVNYSSLLSPQMQSQVNPQPIATPGAATVNQLNQYQSAGLNPSQTAGAIRQAALTSGRLR